MHAPLAPTEYDHVGHVPHAAVPAGANAPAPHVTHVTANVAPTSADAVPFGHSVHAVALAPAHCPAGHCTQVNVTKSVENFL